MVGDDMRDVQAGINAGCVPVFLTNDKPYENMNSVKTFSSLQDFTNQLLS
jgi:histidinol phosphatase-like enzyme